MAFQAFHVAGTGRLVVCVAHGTDVLMWLWQEAEGPWAAVELREGEQSCVLCQPGVRGPRTLRQALKRQALKPAA
jgi:hypothetical protein